MSAVTAVPLRPIKKGSVSRLWIGVAAVVLAAAGLSHVALGNFGTSPTGLRYEIVDKGTGPHPTKDDFALVSYVGRLDDGTIFDQSERAPMALASVVPGFAEAISMMGKGGHVRVAIPSNLGYGDSAPPGSNIPAGATLHFDIRLLEFKTKAEMMELQRQMQAQQMQQMMQGGGRPGGAPVGPPEGPPMPPPPGPEAGPPLPPQ